MALKLAILAVCVTIVKGNCVFSDNPGLFPNGFQNGGDNAVVGGPIRLQDLNPLYGHSLDVNVDNPMELMQEDDPYNWMRGCDNGVIVFADIQGNLPNCPPNGDITNIDDTQTFAFVAADAILESDTDVEFQVEAYHMFRENEFDSAGLKSGASLCDLEKIQGFITDCDDTHRWNITVKEAVVFTWKIGGSDFPSGYYFQVIIAVADYDGTDMTRVMFLYEDRQNKDGTNNVIKGQIHASNQGLGVGEVRYSRICDADIETEIHMKSNCRCAQKGHYVFDTMETTDAPHGYCGTGRDRCASQYMLDDDGMTINRNCRFPRKPLDTCHATVSCLEDTTNKAIVLQFKNVAADRYIFLDYDAFNPGGFSDPHGTNIEVRPSPACSDSITPTNDTFQEIQGLGFTTVSDCFTYDSTTNVASYVIAFYDSAVGFNVTTYKSRIYVGHCFFNDLPQFFRGTHAIGQVPKTTLPARTGRTLAMTYWDRRGLTGRQIFDSGTTVELGRSIYIAICFNPGNPFNENADDYGVYGYDCWASNNAGFATDGDNRVRQLINENGCPTSSRVQESFVATNNIAFGYPFCIVTGAFSAFRWKIGEKKLYLRCKANFCRNTQLFGGSKCNDSCSNTLINSVPDDGDDDLRRRRAADDDDEELFLVINVADKADSTDMAASKDCADPSMAKSVIGALVTLLILSTILTVFLFCVLQRKTKTK